MRVTPYAGVWIEICGELRISADTWSLPTRECGLKYFPLNLYQMYHLSLPTRECGLKCQYVKMTVDSALSLPTRECGLKYDEKDRICIRINVTPYAGVWIEIQYIRRGRWIYVSLPTRECGLKSL